MNEGLDGLIDRLVTAGFFLEEAVEILEKGMIERQLRQHAGNQSAASKALGIHRNTLLRKMLQYGIDTKRPRSKPPASVKGKTARRNNRTA
jgi:DNA-binding NtrC family response regulator